MRVGVIGTGFGANHARMYKEMDTTDLVVVCDLNMDRGAAVAQEHGVAFESDYLRILDRVDAVSIAVPTREHKPIACKCLEHGVHVLLEKPIAASLEEADYIIEAAKQGGAVLHVGHLLRFNPAVIAARKILTNPSYFEIHRLSQYTDRSADQDVIVDLMIHDIDIVLSFVGCGIEEIRAVGETIVSKKTDIANAWIRFDNGCVANLTAGRVYKKEVRKFRSYQEGLYVSIDYEAKAGTVAKIDHQHPRELIIDDLQVNGFNPLRYELESFIKSIKGEKPVITIDEARSALEVALEIGSKL